MFNAFIKQDAIELLLNTFELLGVPNILEVPAVKWDGYKPNCLNVKVRSHLPKKVFYDRGDKFGLCGCS